MADTPADVRVTIVGPGATLVDVSLREVMTRQETPSGYWERTSGETYEDHHAAARELWIVETLSGDTVEFPLSWLADAMPIPRFARMLTIRVERVGAAIFRELPYHPPSQGCQVCPAGIGCNQPAREWPGV